MSLLKDEMSKYAAMFPKDLKSLSTEQLSQIILKLNAEETALSNKLIQIETQIQEKKKVLDLREKEIKEKYGVSSIEELQAKKEEIEKELQEELAKLQNLIQ